MVVVVGYYVVLCGDVLWWLFGVDLWCDDVELC